MSVDHQDGGGRLRAFIERIERLEEEKKAVADDVKAVYAEAKAEGFETKVMRYLVKLRKQDAQERAEFEAVLALYLHAMGMEDLDDIDDELREPIRAGRHDGAGMGGVVG